MYKINSMYPANCDNTSTCVPVDYRVGLTGKLLNTYDKLYNNVYFEEEDEEVLNV